MHVGWVSCVVLVGPCGAVQRGHLCLPPPVPRGRVRHTERGGQWPAAAAAKDEKRKEEDEKRKEEEEEADWAAATAVGVTVAPLRIASQLTTPMPVHVCYASVVWQVREELAKRALWDKTCLEAVREVVDIMAKVRQ